MPVLVMRFGKIRNIRAIETSKKYEYYYISSSLRIKIQLTFYLFVHELKIEIK